MSLPTFDDMLAMTKEQLDTLYHTELEAVLGTVTDPEKAARYRAIAGGKVMRLERIKNPYMRAEQANHDMMESFSELSDLLKQFKEVSGYDL